MEHVKYLLINTCVLMYGSQLKKSTMSTFYDVSFPIGKKFVMSFQCYINVLLRNAKPIIAVIEPL